MSAPRPSRPGDESGLRRLWKEVFGDSDEFLDCFFREVYSPGMAWVMEAGGRIAAAAYALPFGAYRYIYAVATLPDCRGRGYGRAVTLAAAEGKPAYLCPADEGLARWYAETVGASPADRRREETPPAALRPVSAAAWNEKRERLLKDVPHAVYAPGVLALFSLNGGFFEDDSGALWAVENGRTAEHVPPSPGGEPYLYGLNGAPAIHWGLTLA